MAWSEWKRFGGGSDEQLLFSGMESSPSDSAHVAVLSSQVVKGELFDEYLSMDSANKVLTVKKDCTLALIGKVSSYSGSGGTYSQGQVIYNGTALGTYRVSYIGTGAYKTKSYVKNAVAGDTISAKTPNTEGYPKQALRVYLITNEETTIINDLATWMNTVSS